MKLTKIEQQTNKFISDLVIKEIEKALFHAFGTKEVTAHTAAGPMDKEKFIEQLKSYKDFFDKDYKRRQEQQKRLADSYDALVHAIEQQKKERIPQPTYRTLSSDSWVSVGNKILKGEFDK